jgi:hypothetical protein
VLVLFGGWFADEDEAAVGIGDVELGHSVFAVEEVPDAVLVFEGLDVVPDGVDVGDLDVDLGVVAQVS